MNQILISLAILALWALTSLLSRDAQPLPPRPVRGRSPEGPRPAPGLARNDQLGAGQMRANTEGVSGRLTESRLSSRPLESSLLARSGPGRGAISNDEIRILDSDSRSARPVSGSGGAISTGAAPARGQRKDPRRGPRLRGSASPALSKPIEPNRQRALTSQVNQSLAQAMGRPYEGLQLEAPLASLSSSLAPLATRGASIEPAKRKLQPGPGMDVDAIRGMLESPSRLREIAVLSELLKPPLALRRRGRFR
jgi:hypothetical protein